MLQGWRDQDDRDGPGYGDLLKDVEEEEEQLQREEHFEAKYNFRFEVGVLHQLRNPLQLCTFL